MNESTLELENLGRSDDPLSDIRFVDCDAHFSEPPDLWTSRMPRSLSSRAPVLKTVDGQSNWYLGDEIFASMGGNAIRKGRERIHGCLGSIQPFEDLDESAWSVPARVKLMDELGILAQIVYPNGIGFSSNYIFAIEDVRERKALLQAYNDFYVDVQSESGGRLLPQCMLPIWDMQFTVDEMTRLIDQKVTGFTLSDRPELLGLPEIIRIVLRPHVGPLPPVRYRGHFPPGRGGDESGARSRAGNGRRTRSGPRLGPQRPSGRCRTRMVVTSAAATELCRHRPNVYEQRPDRVEPLP